MERSSTDFHDTEKAKPSLSGFTVSRIAGTVFRTKGATFSDVARALSVSRITAMRWLALMENEGLLTRTQAMSGKRGRPQGIYRPTDKLMKLVETHSSGSIAILNFPTLKGACKHLTDGKCRFGKKPQVCAAFICPLLHF